MKTGLRKYVGADEPIHYVYMYYAYFSLQCDLLTIFETDNWYWSIEKHRDGITIQRSRNIESVRDKYKQNNRKGWVTFLSKTEGDLTVYQLIDWLYDNKELLKPYNSLNNCDEFCENVYNYISKSAPLRK